MPSTTITTGSEPSTSSNRRSSFERDQEISLEEAHGTNIDIQDYPEEDPRNEDNITFKVLGSAIVTIAGAKIECQNNA
jgi:hypothetical protein